VQTFVLIPGAWSGGWIWDLVAERLRSLGHSVRQVTLPGLESGYSPVADIGLAEHVDAVVEILNADDLRDVVLVAHDYGGIVAGIVAGRIPERVAHTVFVEAFLPHEGASMLESFPATQQREEAALIAEHGGRWPVPDPEVIGEGQDLSPRQVTWIAGSAVGHPGRTLTEPARLTRPLADLSATYVVCAMNHVEGLLAPDVEAMRAHWSFRVMKTGYWPMISAPDALADVLVSARRRHQEG